MGCLKLSYYQTHKLKVISTKKILTFKKSIKKARRYNELKDHLANVKTVISDEKLITDAGTPNVIDNNDNFTPKVLSALAYYPFGMKMPGTQFYANDKPRYTFNGKEEDPENEGRQDYGMRIYDPALGKFLSVDPLTDEYPYYTPYQFSANQPIHSVDIDGLESSNDLNPTGLENCAEVCIDGKETAVDKSLLNVKLTSKGVDLFFDQDEDIYSFILENRNHLDQVDVVTTDPNTIVSPVSNPLVTSEMSPSRVDPVGGKKSTPHNGIDIVSNSGRTDGKDVTAPAIGVINSVKTKEDGNGAGNRVHMKDKKGNTYSFFHLQDNSIKVKTGDKVQKGQVIGKIGTTGHSTGSHLHFEMKDAKGKRVDPAKNIKQLENAPRKEKQAKQKSKPIKT